MSTLDRAVEIATQAHAGQVDKAGEPYIAHPLRVMRSMSTDAEKIAAVLHDLVEDTPKQTNIGTAHIDPESTSRDP